MRYFKPSASTGLTREVSSKALDIVFWPFSDAASISSNENEESDRASAAKEGFEGEMGLVQKGEIALRLLSLISDSATKGHLVPAATLSELVQRMKALPHANFTSLIELLPRYCPSSSPFLPCLLASYIQTQSHSLSATSPSNPSTAIDPSTNLPLSSFWGVPELDSKDFCRLMSRLPIEVPLPAVAEGEGTRSGAKRPMPKVLKSSPARAGAVAESHRLVKGMLITWLFKQKRGSLGEALLEVREALGKVDDSWTMLAEGRRAKESDERVYTSTHAV
ncbi:hypothetical protein JCM5296_006129 [Sporobolomyces johnsonii]